MRSGAGSSLRWNGGCPGSHPYSHPDLGTVDVLVLSGVLCPEVLGIPILGPEMVGVPVLDRFSLDFRQDREISNVRISSIDRWRDWAPPVGGAQAMRFRRVPSRTGWWMPAIPCR